MASAQPPSPDTSVIIVSFRAYEELEACLAALMADDVEDMAREIIVIDHDTEPGGADRIRRRFPSVRLLATGDNPGYAAGINRGASLAEGRWLVLLNADTRVRPGALGTMVRYLAAHPDTAVVGVTTVDAQGRRLPSARRFPTALTGLAGRSAPLTRLWPSNPWSRRECLADDAATDPVDVDWVAGSCMAVDAAAFRRVGGMDERFFLYWEDADLCRRLRLAGRRTCFLPGATIVHAVGASRRHARLRSLRAFHRSAWLYVATHDATRLRPVTLAVVWIALQLRMVAAVMALPLVLCREDWLPRWRRRLTSPRD